MKTLQDSDYCSLLHHHLAEFNNRLDNLIIDINSDKFSSNIKGIVNYYNEGHKSFDYSFDYNGMHCIIQFMTLGIEDVLKLGLDFTSKPMPVLVKYQFKDFEIIPSALLALCLDVEGTTDVIKKDISLRMNIIKKIEHRNDELD